MLRAKALGLLFEAHRARWGCPKGEGEDPSSLILGLDQGTWLGSCRVLLTLREAGRTNAFVQGFLRREEDPILHRLGEGEPIERMGTGSLDLGEYEPDDGPNAGLCPREVDDKD